MSADPGTARNEPASAGKGGLALLAPALIGLLPTLLLATARHNKDESYEWAQHTVAGLGFAISFLLVFLRGPWRQTRRMEWLGALVLGALAFAGWRAGLPGFHPLLAVAGAGVAAGYWFARREAPPPWLETAVVGLAATAGFWAVSRLSWWQPIAVTLQSWPNRILFLGTTAGLIGLLCALTRDGRATGSRGLARAIDAAVLLVLAGAVLRTNTLPDYPAFPHHWGVYVAPADLVREGGVLLGDVPSQYGFLTTLLLAALPTGDRFTALFWVNSVLLWTSGFVIYYTLTSWLPRWWWRILAGLATVGCVAFFCGYPGDLTGPMPFPSVGAMRFIWAHLLLGYLAWWHRRTTTHPVPIRTALWTGSVLWLLGVLWSVESALYVTAAWFPAAALLAMRPAVETLSLPARIAALFAGIGRALLIPGGLLAGMLILLTGYYRLVLGRTPDWPAYWEYATAFSGGFGSLPADPQGGVWTLLLIHAGLVALLLDLETDRQRGALALIWAAWGALWTASTYYIARSHDNNMTNLSPVMLLVIGLLVQAWKLNHRRGPGSRWVWLTVPSFVGAMLWPVLGNGPALRQQWKTYAVEPHTGQLRPAPGEGLKELTARCQQVRPGPYSIFDQYIMRADNPTDQPEWLPLRSAVLLGPLHQTRIEHYLDAHRREPGGGWLLIPAGVNHEEFHWLFRYIDARFSVHLKLTQGDWVAHYYLPRPPGPELDWLPLDGAGLNANVFFGRDVRMMLPPVELSWTLRGDERELFLDLGYDPTAYLEGNGNGTRYTVELKTPAGMVFPIYDRLLDPVKNTADRAIVRDSLAFPPFPAGSRLTLRTTPGPHNDNAWDWAHVAMAAVVRQPGYSLRQFPGFSRVPEALASEVIYLSQEDNRTVLGLHAPATMTFRLQGGERTVAFDYGLRSGTYRDGGNTDGAGFRVTLRVPGQPDATVFERLLQPVARADDQGIQHASFSLPANLPAGAELVLAIDNGPHNSAAWDWTYAGNFQIK